MSVDASKRPLTRRPLAIAGVLLLAGVVAFLLVRAVHLARESARFTQCRQNLMQIELALSNYHEAWGCFPPAATYGPDGKPWHSWRMLIIPQLEANPLYSYYRMDEPWDGPNNRKLADLYANWPHFRCPSNEAAAPGETSYLAVVGRHTMWPPDEPAKLSDATDGPETVIQVVEVANSGVHWMEPKDLRLDAISRKLNGPGESIRSRHTQTGLLSDGPPKANAAFADGSVRPIKADVPPETLKSMLLRDDGGPKGLP